MKRKRCPNGTRKNKKNGQCEPRPVKTLKTSNISTLTKHANTIQRFMKTTKHARISHFLNKSCPDSNICIAFGKEIKKIKEFFGNFDLSYVKDNIRRIGSAQNGFVNELKFTHKEYSAYAVLKSSSSVNSDNLMYEYRGGLFLNKMSLLYPCFVETYKLFKYNNLTSFKYVKTHRNIPSDRFKQHITLQDYDLKSACKSPVINSVLIQHLKHSNTMFNVLNTADISLNYNFLTLLYQVYFVLDQMKDIFTHYDLHGNNVMLYEPSPTKYIHYHYHLDTEVVSFKSIYVAKIIDYGRCYFKDDVYSSKEFLHEMCAKKECNTRKSGKCGKKAGFAWLSPPIDFYVDSSSSNKSHDLKLIETLLDMIRYKSMYKQLPTLLPWFRGCVSNLYSDLIYQGGVDYGTPEKIYCPFKLCSVSGVSERLKDELKNINLDTLFDTYYLSRTKLGDMHVYSDGSPLQFIES